MISPPSTPSRLWPRVQYDAFVTKLAPDASSASWVAIQANWWFINTLCPYEAFYGLLPLTVYGSREVSVRDINLATLAVEGLMTPPKKARQFAVVYGDFNADGLTDVRFRLAARGQRFLDGENKVTLTARTRDGGLVKGETSYRLSAAALLCTTEVR